MTTPACHIKCSSLNSIDFSDAKCFDIQQSIVRFMWNEQFTLNVIQWKRNLFDFNAHDIREKKIIWENAVC